MLGEERHMIMYFFLELCHSLYLTSEAGFLLWPNNPPRNIHSQRLWYAHDIV